MSAPDDEQTIAPQHYTTGQVARLLGRSEKYVRNRDEILGAVRDALGQRLYPRALIHEHAIEILGPTVAAAAIEAADERRPERRKRHALAPDDVILIDDALVLIGTNRDTLNRLLGAHEVRIDGRRYLPRVEVDRVAAERADPADRAPKAARRKPVHVSRPESLPAHCAHSTRDPDPERCSQCWGACPERVLLAAAPVVGAMVRGRYWYGDGGIVAPAGHDGGAL